MDFGKLMQEAEYLVKGTHTLLMDSSAPLKRNAESLQEQRHDLLYILSDLTVEQIEDMDESLEEAIEGFMKFGNSLDNLAAVAEGLKESDSPEIPQIGDVLSKLREQTADQGLILKTLKDVTHTILCSEAAV